MNRHAATPVIGWTIAIVLMAIGCALGTWQLRRMHQKETMLASVATVLRERTPQPLAIASTIPTTAREPNTLAAAKAP